MRSKTGKFFFMRMHLLRFIFTVVIVSSLTQVSGQESKIDSLKTLIDTEENNAKVGIP